MLTVLEPGVAVAPMTPGMGQKQHLGWVSESGTSLIQEQSGESVGLRFWARTKDRTLTFITPYPSPSVLLPDDVVESPRAEGTDSFNFSVAVTEGLKFFQ